MQYNKNQVLSKKGSKEQIMELFNELHYKWRDGMDITAYKEDSRQHRKLMMKFNTFFDDDVLELGAKIVDSGKASHYAVVAWLANCEYFENADGIVIYTRNSMAADRASETFGAIIFEITKKPVRFLYNKAIRDRMAA
jgi:hypothetical protein